MNGFSAAPPSNRPFLQGDGRSVGDKQLVRNLQREPNEAPYIAFVQRFERPVFALLSRYLSGSPLAAVEDLAQETFLRAFGALPTFDLAGEAKVSTWIFTIASRLAIDFKKRKNPVATHHDADRPLKVASDQEVPEGELRRRELGLALELATSTLPKAQRVPFILSWFNGLSLREFA